MTDRPNGNGWRLILATVAGLCLILILGLVIVGHLDTRMSALEAQNKIILERQNERTPKFADFDKRLSELEYRAGLSRR
jgi:hypothetical protein